MKEIKIDDLAYVIKKSKENGQPRPIFFLGAGASRTGNIPLANEIESQILSDCSDVPMIKRLSADKKIYSELMNCLLPMERDELLKNYINKAKVNVTHIYLAQLLKEDFVDYVLTVNFDNLMIKALALLNIFPATYDMAILKDLTTTTFKEKSIVYLHGQHHGLWLLNTKEEMDKVKNIVPRIFDSIKNKRPWIFIGYSGNDPIFEHIKNLGRFDNGFYWVTYKDNIPCKSVQEFISSPNTNAFILKGYDSDSFMLKLNSELGLEQPNIINKPFTALKDMIEGIIDIEEKEHFKYVKERLEVSRRQIDKAINYYEYGNFSFEKNYKNENKIDLLKRNMINIIINNQYDNSDVLDIEKEVKQDKNLKTLLSNLYFNWGNYLLNSENIKDDDKFEKTYRESFEKFQKSLELKSDYIEVYNNYGTALSGLARKINNEESDKLYNSALEKFQKALELKDDDPYTYNNLGTLYWDLASTKNGTEKESFYNKSIENYNKSLKLKEDNWLVYSNLGSILLNLGILKKNEESEKLYEEAIRKFQKSKELEEKNTTIYMDWGIAILNLGKLKKGKESELLYDEALKKFRKSIELNGEDFQTYRLIGETLFMLSKFKDDNDKKELYDQAIIYYKKAIDINDKDPYIYNNLANVFCSLAKLKKKKEAELLYNEAIKTYERALELKEHFHEAYNNLGITILELARIMENEKSDEMYKLALEKCKKAIDIGGASYNYACINSFLNNKEEALSYLERSLINKEMSVDFVREDSDWENLSSSKEFMDLLVKYEN